MTATAIIPGYIYRVTFRGAEHIVFSPHPTDAIITVAQFLGIFED